jgi:MoxR-like ATPase
MFQVEVSYPKVDQELEIVERTTREDSVQLNPQLSAEELVGLQDLVRTVPAGREMVALAVELVRASRPGPDAPDFVNRWIAWGAGPRASQFLVLGAKARALMDGRFAVSREDITSLARPVLSHRILRNFKAEAEGVTTASLVEQLLSSVDRPAEL